jgi:hypothetical protein
MASREMLDQFGFETSAEMYQALRKVKITMKEFRREMLLYPEEVVRPRVRAECRDSDRPCPYVMCRYHTYLTVGEGGAIRFNFPGKSPLEIEHSCVLDLAEDPTVAFGIKKEVVSEWVHMTLFQMSEMYGLTRERIRQIEKSGIRKLRDSCSDILAECHTG